MLKNFIELVYDPKPNQTDPILPMDVTFLESKAVCEIRRNNPTVFKLYSSRYRRLPIQLASTWWPVQACG
jgi:hypothetical protein